MSGHNDDAKVIYHYTNASALLSILNGEGNSSREGVLWVSEALFLNDSQELLAGRDELVAQLNDYADAPGVDSTVSTMSSRPPSDIARRAAEGLLNTGTMTPLPYRAFITCFCENPDLLSQWRSYGEAGYSIGFDVAILKASLKPKAFNFDSHGDSYVMPRLPLLKKVVYDPAGLTALVRRSMGMVVDNNAGGTRGHGYLLADMAALEILAQVKDETFREEAEWRLIYVRQAGQSKGFAEEYPQSDFRPSVKARSGTLNIIPYLKMEFGKSAIREIYVGPGANQDLRIQALTRVIEDLDLEVSIRASSIPYRAGS